MHSTNLVPFILISNLIYTIEKTSQITLDETGSLINIAPTILDILNINIPKEMNGTSLIKKSINQINAY